jgi:hypothetical protein
MVSAQRPSAVCDSHGLRTPTLPSASSATGERLGKGNAMTSTAHPPSGAFDQPAAVNARRLVNDEIAATAMRFYGGDGSLFEFVCECGDLACRGIARLSLEDYRRSEPGSVVGH